MKKIIIQGDDWGYKPEADLGIEKAYEHGILTQTTVMVNQLNVKNKKEYQARINDLTNKTPLKKPKMGIGVHLNLTYGKPLSPHWPQTEFTRPLRGSGKPEEWQGSAWRKYFQQFTKRQITDEFQRQINLALNIFGEVSHLDSHQMIASYPPMLELYEHFALEYHLPIRPIAPLSENPIYGGDFVVDRKINQRLKQKGINIPDQNIFELFFNADNPMESFLSKVETISDEKTVEFMFHPAFGKGSEDWRLKDFNTLTHQEVVSYFQNENIELINYQQL